MAHWPVTDDCLVVGGMPLPQLAERVGRTPFYAYDRRLLAERIGLVRRHLPPRIKLHYAMKANPMPALVGHLVGWWTAWTSRQAASSRWRSMLERIRARSASPVRARASPSSRRPIAAGILLNVESMREIELLGRLSRELKLPARVAVRVNPDFELEDRPE